MYNREPKGFIAKARKDNFVMSLLAHEPPEFITGGTCAPISSATFLMNKVLICRVLKYVNDNGVNQCRNDRILMLVIEIW